MNLNKNFQNNFDVIVVGGGHAGIEAAYAAAKMGVKVLMVTINEDRIGHMPCNPAIGGIGKGHIVFEIAAFDGLMPKIATKTYLQARMLNTSKGPAVHGLRLQIDKPEYSKHCREALQKHPNIKIITGMVEGLLIEDNKVIGVKVKENYLTTTSPAYSEQIAELELSQNKRESLINSEKISTYKAPCVILTTGTFLNGLVHVGHTNHQSGRRGEEASVNLSENLKNFNIKIGRLKTGTPPRLLKESLDFSKMEIQNSDDLDYLFEFLPHKVKPILPCYITHTTKETHDIITKNAEHSPIYSGKIKGTPPRYCPSIEDKIRRFPNKDSHHVFVEPESLSGEEIYPNGLSTSLPLEIQYKFIQSIPGFEKAVITQPGYAIEYDFVYPEQLTHSLEFKGIEGLFLAGQINGTTGYEEAAGQGLIAGINASLKIQNKEAFILDRNESYIGIMIDDLVTLGVDEPYRMFTSRAERRLILRQDNSFIRLSDYAYNLGLVDQKIHEEIVDEKEKIKNISATLQQQRGSEIVQLLTKGETEKVYSIIKEFIKENYQEAKSKEFLEENCQETQSKEFSKKNHYQETQIVSEKDFKSEKPACTLSSQKEVISSVEKSDSFLASNKSYISSTLQTLSPRAMVSIYAELLYGPYLKREQREIEKSLQYKNLLIPENFDYKGVPGLSIELQQKLTKYRPKNIAQATLISGMTPAAISLLIFKSRLANK